MSYIYLPSLRGIMGEWIYYSSMMTFEQISEYVSLANEIHNNKNLSKLIQREIKEGRGKDISNYLIKEKERFFNSLVIAVYGGDPEWLPIGVKSNNDLIDLSEISDSFLNSFGYLRFTGEEKLFAVDGQHRLIGIKEAIKEKSKLKKEEISVIFLAHKNTTVGIKRTRRLFTTLNKTAIKVSKGEIIALDENDIMAIIVRRLVEENSLFNNNKIAFKATNNITEKDTESLTTIGNLYDVLTILIHKISKTGKKKTLNDLKFLRPSTEEIDMYYEFVCDIFSKIINEIPVLKEFFTSKECSKTILKYRNKNGGNLLFRPIGLSIVFDVLSKLTTTYDLEESIKRISKIPLDLCQAPYKEIIFKTSKSNIIPKGRTIVRNTLLYMLGYYSKEADKEKTNVNYSNCLGLDESVDNLPEKLF